MKIVTLRKICLNETYSRGCVVKHLSDRFSIKNVLKKGDALRPLPFSFALEYAIRKFNGNREGFELKGTYQFWFVLMTLIYVLGGSIYTTTRKTDALVVANKGTDLEVNADKNKYMVISREQHA